MRAWLLTALALTACSQVISKVPLLLVEAGFTVSDAAWFEAEHTLFIFYRVNAEQGIGPESVVEVTYETDDEVVPWTEVPLLPTVHTHVAAVCDANALCGSTSLRVDKVPRNVGIRLRWARGGEMALTPTVNFNVVGQGPAWSNRSLLVYGVFDATNARVEWRARHVFPTLRNEQVSDLGLRRAFTVDDERYGTIPDSILPNADNPYGYGFAQACPGSFVPTDEPGPVNTLARAAFDQASLPLAASTALQVCARTTVTDALGLFIAPALARKNPEVRPAFPVLRSPIRVDSQLRFALQPCQRVISDAHLAMQKQRLRWSEFDETVCVDDFQQPGFVASLAGHFIARIESERPRGDDMVLAIALHHDDETGALGMLVETALDQVLTPEGTKSSPRVVGAFVLDSYPHAIATKGLGRKVLWCPAVPIMKPGGSLAADQACAVQPDSPDLKLGPFSFGQLPILPTREKYLAFIAKYSDTEAGWVTDLVFRAPERTPTSSDVPMGDFGVATFFNDEIISAAPTDAFSYCPTDTPPPAVFRVAVAPDVIPLSYLPEVQRQAPQGTYELGLAWDFPYLMRMDYRTVLAGAATAFSFTVPFGIGSDSQSYYGTQLWEQGEFSLADALCQCTRFCDQPTFDSAGVYQVTARFNETYGDQCYRPLYPTPDDQGFPSDP